MPFIPKDSINSAGARNRIAIIGPPGSGKTTSLLTFPNLYVFDRDKNLPPGVPSTPAWNPDWVQSMGIKNTVTGVPNFRDATLKWFRENHNKFEEDQTLALDSWSFVQDACDLQTAAEEKLQPSNEKGNRDGFWFWNQKLKYSQEIAEYLKSMKCNVVVTLHEVVDRDEKGRINGKIRPVQAGQFKDVLLGVFNNVWRMRGHMPANTNALAARNPDGTKKDVPLNFYWELYGSSVVDLKLDATLGRYCRANGIKTIPIKWDEKNGVYTGGYKVIQEIYAHCDKGTPVNVEKTEFLPEQSEVTIK